LIRWLLLCASGCSLVVGTEGRVVGDAGRRADSAVVDRTADAASNCDSKQCAAQAQCKATCANDLADCENQCKDNQGQGSQCKQLCAANAKSCESACGACATCSN